MFIVKWFKSLFYSLPMFQKHAKVLFLGLENAGKTSMLVRLTESTFKQTEPTNFTLCKEVQIGRVHFKAFDVGGHETMRKVWGKYLDGINGVIYMVDSSDKEALETSKKELHNLMNDARLDNAAILVFGNKIDKRTAISETDLAYELGLKTADGKKTVRDGIELYMCSAAKNVGIYEGFEWFSKQVTK